LVVVFFLRVPVELNWLLDYFAKKSFLSEVADRTNCLFLGGSVDSQAVIMVAELADTAPEGFFLVNDLLSLAHALDKLVGLESVLIDAYL
jgi:hypothetical protein